MTCQHHWIIDSTNYGICQTCGDVHQFVPQKIRNWAIAPRREWENPFFPLVIPYAKEKPKE